MKTLVDGLAVNTMGVRWGDTKPAKRESIIVEGCLGANPPTINGMQVNMSFLRGCYAMN
jgi:hypothetical protein